MKRKGFSLLEVLIAIAIIAIMVLMFMQVTTSGMKVTKHSYDISDSYAITQQEAETAEATFKSLRSEYSSDEVKWQEIIGYLKDGYFGGDAKLKQSLEKIRGAGLNEFSMNLFDREIKGFIRPLAIKPDYTTTPGVGNLTLFLSEANIPVPPMPKLRNFPEIEVRVVKGNGNSEKIVNTDDIWKDDFLNPYLLKSGDKLRDSQELKAVGELYDNKDAMNIYFVGISADAEPESPKNAKMDFSKYEWLSGELIEKEDGTVYVTEPKIIKIFNSAYTLPSYTLPSSKFKFEDITKYDKPDGLQHFDIINPRDIKPKDQGKEPKFLEYGSYRKTGKDYLRIADWNGKSKFEPLSSGNKDENIFKFIDLDNGYKKLNISSGGTNFKYDTDDAKLYYDLFELEIPHPEHSDKKVRRAIGFKQTPISGDGVEGNPVTRWFYLPEQDNKVKVQYEFEMKDGTSLPSELQTAQKNHNDNLTVKEVKKGENYNLEFIKDDKGNPVKLNGKFKDYTLTQYLYDAGNGKTQLTDEIFTVPDDVGDTLTIYYVWEKKKTNDVDDHSEDFVYNTPGDEGNFTRVKGPYEHDKLQYWNNSRPAIKLNDLMVDLDGDGEEDENIINLINPTAYDAASGKPIPRRFLFTVNYYFRSGKKVTDPYLSHDFHVAKKAYTNENQFVYIPNFPKIEGDSVEYVECLISDAHDKNRILRRSAIWILSPGETEISQDRIDKRPITTAFDKYEAEFDGFYNGNTKITTLPNANVYLNAKFKIKKNGEYVSAKDEGIKYSVEYGLRSTTDGYYTAGYSGGYGVLSNNFRTYYDNLIRLRLFEKDVKTEITQTNYLIGAYSISLQPLSNYDVVVNSWYSGGTKMSKLPSTQSQQIQMRYDLKQGAKKFKNPTQEQLYYSMVFYNSDKELGHTRPIMTAGVNAGDYENILTPYFNLNHFGKITKLEVRFFIGMPTSYNSTDNLIKTYELNNFEIRPK